MSNKSKKATEVQGAKVESFESVNQVSWVEKAYDDAKEPRQEKAEPNNSGVTKKEQAKSVSYALKAVCKHLDTLRDSGLMHQAIYEQVMLELESSKREFVRREYGI